jgi:hypothetical protein
LILTRRSEDATPNGEIAVARLDNLTDAERKLITEQRQVWRALGVAKEGFKVGDEIAGIKINRIK